MPKKYFGTKVKINSILIHISTIGNSKKGLKITSKCFVFVQITHMGLNDSSTMCILGWSTNVTLREIPLSHWMKSNGLSLVCIF